MVQKIKCSSCKKKVWKSSKVIRKMSKHQIKNYKCRRCAKLQRDVDKIFDDAIAVGKK